MGAGLGSYEQIEGRIPLDESSIMPLILSTTIHTYMGAGLVLMTKLNDRFCWMRLLESWQTMIQ